MSKISALTELAEVPATTDEVVVLDKSDTTMSAAGTNKRNSRKNFLGYTEYVALLTQAGTAAPTAVDIKNDTGATVVYGYTINGLYTMTFSSAVLTANKTVAILVNNDAAYEFSATTISTTQVNLSTQEAGTGFNSVLSATPVIVRIYV